MAAKTWDNGGGDGLWSTGANWSDNAVPATNDPLTFDGTSGATCTIDAVGTWSGGTLTIVDTYTGDIIQNVAITLSGTVSVGGATNGLTWTANANILGSPTMAIGATGTFTRTAGTMTAAFTVNATGILNLGTDPTVNNIATNSGSTITGTGVVTFTAGTTNLVNGTAWDTSGVTRLNLSSTFSHMNQGTSEGSFSGVPIYVTGSSTTRFSGGNFDWNVVSVVKTGSGSFTIEATADVDFGASPTIVSNGMTVTGEMIASGTVVFDQLSTASPVAWSVGSGAIAGGGFTNITLRGSLTINAAATWPANVILHIDPDQNVTATIDASGRTFGTCTIAGSTTVALTIAASASITLAAGSVAAFTGVFTVTGTLNLLGNLTLVGGLTTSASSTLSGTGIITLTECALTMNATCTVSATIGWIQNFTSATVRTFAGGGKTYASFQRTGSGSGQLTISGSNTFTGAFTDNDGQVAHTILFTASTTTTAAAWNLKGSSGKILTINSTTTTNFTVATTGGVNIVCSYISVANSNADAAPVWYAGATPPSVNGGGGNANWVFTAPPNVNLYDRQQAQVIM